MDAELGQDLAGLALDCAHRATEFGGRLGFGEILEVPQDENRTLPWRQLPQCLPDLGCAGRVDDCAVGWGGVQNLTSSNATS